MWTWARVGFIVVVSAGVALVTLPAQRDTTAVEWLPPADSLPAHLATLLVLDRASRTPVDHPWFCIDPRDSWMIGMPDGRVRFSRGDLGDTIHLRISGPWHEERAVSLPWAQLVGRGAIVTLVRRVGERVEPAC